MKAKCDEVDLKQDVMGLTFEEGDLEQLEKKYSIVIQANRATVSTRRWLLPDKPLFTATAFLGTKAVDVKMNSINGVPGLIFDMDCKETLTESNVAFQVEVICLFVLANWDAAQKFVNAA